MMSISIAAAMVMLASATSAPASAQTGLRFVPITPCRIADTRNPDGPFGGPYIAGNTSRSFALRATACSVAPDAQAYSLNVTVVPMTGLGYLTLWPTGEPQPTVSTLNSPDGRVRANAAIVPAGDNGAISVFATNGTHVVLDVNGYFVSDTNPSALAFYPVTPCRVADTRDAMGPLGGPHLTGSSSRDFAVLSSACNLPPEARAYSMNFTAVPRGGLGYLTVSPAGEDRPLVSTLNAPTGVVTANAAIVPAGENGAISAFASNDCDLVIDVNGYFAPPSAGGLSLYNLTPCRLVDTRNGSGMPVTALLTAKIAGNCGVPPSALGYVLNATVVPQSPLGYLTLWPQGQAQPLASTLNSPDGQVTSNMALLPAGTSQSVSAYATDGTHLILDTFGYFAPNVAGFSIYFNPSSIVWGQQATGSVTLASPAPSGGAAVTLTASTSSGHSFFYSLPNSVVVPAGATSATFPVNTSEIYTTEQLKVNAAYNGTSASATLTLEVPRVISLTLNPATVSAGQTTTATVTLNGPAPNSVQVLVRLGGYTKFASISTSSVTIPAGQSTGQFTVTTGMLPQPVNVSVIAVAAQGATPEVSTDLTINLTTRGRKWVLNNVIFNDGGTASGYFTYDAATGTYLDINITTTPGSDTNKTPFGIRRTDTMGW
ncbi:MAG: hypothetical protein JOZ62_05190 [Acidobacteriaceae bacterium]|nr:hypothetical protein [Acidobacteriaceae bacterium]